MNVLIIGANGQIGQRLVKKLQESSQHNPIAMIRKEEQLKKFEEQGVKTALIDLEGSIDGIANVAKDADAVVFTAGSGGHTGADKTMLIDLDGAIKSMKAAKQAGVKRFIIVSGIGVHRWHTNNYLEWMDSSPVYSAAKYYADVWLERSSLDYTIIRPGKLTNDPGAGKVKVGNGLEFKQISREDVASAIISSLENDQTIGKAFDMIGGETPIEEALRTL
ncbi:SDR family oxidoreductase [Priestia megaterium]|uniref:SDR family oxidoreductase n=1 Tax=Priestia megaterium TaxID=1404 RepID=UPI00207ADAC4|nr:SDR family oxidoreductase [Priestia megaterium]USL27473.1 SDR family oxidoreductase [Priestia megaterium]USL33487.1 SDR family oxidoreductase [Priestia megaterium]USL39422.1 SDR family oxidoreductase [Priestia megaterium]WDM31569.1 SDR family oxidoreductase [Priestia megaterium]